VERPRVSVIVPAYNVAPYRNAAVRCARGEVIALLLAPVAAGLREAAIRSLRAGDARACLQASLEIEPNHLRARAALILAQWPRLARPILSAVYRLREYMP